MKLFRKMAIGFVAVVGLCALYLARPDNAGQKALEEARSALRQEGFKVDLSEFNFFTTPEMREREKILVGAGQVALKDRGSCGKILP